MIVIERLPSTPSDPQQIWRFEFTVTGGRLRLYLAEYERIPPHGAVEIWKVTRDQSAVSPPPITLLEYYDLVHKVVDEADCAARELKFYDGPAVEDD